MGKSIISQKRGKGSPVYRSPSFRYLGDVKYRIYDAAEKTGVIFGKIIDLEHCPGHSAPLAKIAFENGDVIYNFAPNSVRLNDVIASGEKAPLQNGSILPLKNIPEGTLVYNIESQPADGGTFVRAAGTSARILQTLGGKILVELPSKKQRAFDPQCRATIGVICASGMQDKPFLKAGKRWHSLHARNHLYPKVSGVAMNAVNHPFGSGRGRHPGKPLTPPRFAPPGRNVGQIRASRSGVRK